MNSHLRRYGYALVVTLFIFFLILAPARFLMVLMPGGFLQSAGVIRGSLWEGNASSVVVSVNGNAIALGSVHWKIKPLSVLLLSPVMQIDSQWRQQRLFSEFQVAMSGNVQIDSLKLSVPAGIAKHWLPLNLGGQLILNATQIGVVDGALQGGEGILQWKNASWRADTGAVLLGNYQAKISVEDNVVMLSLDDKNEPVGASGWLQLSPDTYSADLSIISQHPAIGNALSLIATRNEGGYRLKLSSS